MKYYQLTASYTYPEASHQSPEFHIKQLADTLLTGIRQARTSWSTVILPLSRIISIIIVSSPSSGTNISLCTAAGLGLLSHPSKYSISSKFSTRAALFDFIRLLQPLENLSSVRPGKAKTSLLYEPAISAVIRAPPLPPTQSQLWHPTVRQLSCCVL